MSCNRLISASVSCSFFLGAVQGLICITALPYRLQGPSLQLMTRQPTYDTLPAPTSCNWYSWKYVSWRLYCNNISTALAFKAVCQFSPCNRKSSVPFLQIFVYIYFVSLSASFPPVVSMPTRVPSAFSRGFCWRRRSRYKKWHGRFIMHLARICSTRLVLFLLTTVKTVKTYMTFIWFSNLSCGKEGERGWRWGEWRRGSVRKCQGNTEVKKKIEKRIRRGYQANKLNNWWICWKVLLCYVVPEISRGVIRGMVTL